MGICGRSFLTTAVLVGLCLCTAFAVPTEPLPGRLDAEPLPTRWVSPDGSPKPLHNVPLSSEPLHTQGPLALVTPLEGRVDAAPNGRIALVVHDSVFDQIDQALTEFTWDLAAAGWSASIYRFVSGSAESLRDYLHSLFISGEGLKGAILIGDIPYVIYEMMQTWDGGTTWEYEDFPCDIYYMDLNGHWLDSLTDRQVQPGNGKYDSRSGDLALEIWVGRIKTGNLTLLGSEAGLITDYLARNRLFRAAPTVTARYALAYDDDDWGSMAAADSQALESVFGIGYCSGIGDAEATTAGDFRDNRLPTSTRWYLVRSHGYAGGHGFYRNNKKAFEYVYPSNYQSIDPPASFFSLFVCSGCDYTYPNNLGGTVAFNPQSSTVLAVGSTKTGGMWEDRFFYTPMGQGCCIGESFRRWFNQVQTLYGSSAPRWWYGMVMLGDPSLHPQPANCPIYRYLTVSAVPLRGGTTVPSTGSHCYPDGQVIPLTAAPSEGFKFDHWEGPVADPYSASTTVRLTEDLSVTAHFAPLTVADAKQCPDNTPITLEGKVVTYAGADVFYIEDDSRTCGIRVEKVAHGLVKGMRADITGTVQTNANKERCITAATAVANGTGNILPVYLNIAAIGGSDWLYEPATGAGQKGVEGGIGPNNIGLLVRVVGRTRRIDASSFGLSYGSTSIKVIVPNGAVPPPPNRFVLLSGVVSCELVEDRVIPVLLLD